jgi:hypothetical protein
MTTQRDRREAAEILRRIVETLPDPTPTQVAFLMGAASGLDEGVRTGKRPPAEPDQATERASSD